MITSKVKLIGNIEECNKHIKRMLIAYTRMIDIIPLNSFSYNSLKDDEITYIDQFLFRFALLQDAMGEKLFRNLLINVGENPKTLTFIDLLNRLDELELLEKDSWFTLRKFRNITTHEYPDLEEEIIDTLNTLVEKTELIYQIFLKVKEFIFDRVLTEIDRSNYVTEVLPVRESE